METKNQGYQILEYVPGSSVSGVVNSAMKRGQLVTMKATTAALDTKELIAANEVGCCVLDRDVLSAADWEAQQANEALGMQTIRSGQAVGEVASAQKVRRAEFEGGDHLDSSVDADTVIGQAVYAKAGKIAEDPGGQGYEVIGHVRRKLTPVDSNNATRVEIEFVL